MDCGRRADCQSATKIVHIIRVNFLQLGSVVPSFCRSSRPSLRHDRGGLVLVGVRVFESDLGIFIHNDLARDMLHKITSAVR